jgi:tetrapyrrole methylase family protein/MazG family protein/ATP diphosphatase
MTRSFAIPEPPPLEQQDGRAYLRLVELMRRLLAPDGCPWDREQDFASLRRYVLEEACEVLDAIDGGRPSDLKEELGDLALQVVFLAELAQRRGWFGHDDVLTGIVRKLVHRHPHVFGETEVSGSEQVVRRWDAIKAEEKRGRRLLDDIPRALPALDGARRISDRVAAVGFDWPDEAGSRAKIDEELAELADARESGDRDAIEHELGDLLFALVNYARHLELDAERALLRASARFRSRFAYVEDAVRAERGDWPRTEAGKPTTGVPLEQLEQHWQAAKERER